MMLAPRTLHRLVAAAIVLSALLPLAACSKRRTPPPPASPAAEAEHDHDHGAGGEAEHIELPAAVRENLGVTFATAEVRSVATTRRFPGRFELLPEARREYRAPAAGRVELLVAQFTPVEVGTPLYRLDAPAWRELQEKLAATEAELEQAIARRDSMVPLREAHRVHERSLATKVDLLNERVYQLKRLRDEGGGSARDLAETQASLNATQAELADVMEKDAELASRTRELSVEVEADRARLDLLFASAASMTGLPIEALREVEGTPGAPRWRRLTAIEVRALASGVVASLEATPGSVVETASLVLTTVEPDRLRFRAVALQADLDRLAPGMPTAIVPARGVASLGTAMAGPLAIDLRGDPTTRTIDLLVTPSALERWARDGVSAHLEVQLAGGTAEVAVPLSSIVRDGLKAIVFRRAADDPDEVERVAVDLGIHDGRWVVVRSGLAAGDQVVVDGAYPLALATSATAQKGGHFHADGTFHEGSHEGDAPPSPAGGGASEADHDHDHDHGHGKETH